MIKGFSVQEHVCFPYIQFNFEKIGYTFIFTGQAIHVKCVQHMY